jgi:hypothetical protein
MSTAMKTSGQAHLLRLLLVIGAATACGTASVDQLGQGGAGGLTAGDGGTPGTGGTAGSSGSVPASGGVTGASGAPAGGTSAGRGGVSSGGAAGTSGSSATGGSSTNGGTGGAGGAGNSSGGGAAGLAGGGGAGNAGRAGTGGSAGNAGGGGCQKGQVEGNEVLWIGDSWIQIPGSQYTIVRDLARDAGALASSESYVNRAVSGSPITTIINQYTTYQAGSTKVKVLVMDGGGIDVMQQGKTQASVTGVVNKVKDHFAKVATDGTTQHIIYYTYPQLPATGPGQDVGPMLQPGLQAACEASSVPCHYLYLEPLFAGHPEYIGGDSLHPSDAGARVIANAIWKIMQDNCIAQ